MTDEPDSMLFEVPVPSKPSLLGALRSFFGVLLVWLITCVLIGSAVLVVVAVLAFGLHAVVQAAIWGWELLDILLDLIT